MAAYTPANDLPIGQKMALLMLRRGDLANAILEHLREMSVPIPAKSDWVSLIDSGHIMKQFYYRGEAQQSRLVLTAGGLHSVSIVMADFAKRYGIHHISHGNAQGNRGAFVRCTCGWGTYQSNNRGAGLTLSRYVAQHMQQAEAGTLPAAYALAKASEAVA